MAKTESIPALCQLEPRELALYFRRASKSTSTKTVAVELLRLIEQEALPPTTFGIFLASADSPCPLFDALWQQHSKYVRHVAILWFGKAMRSADWEVAWEEVGATEGLLSLLSQMSVYEVRELSKSIGRCKGRSEDNGEKRKQRITELLQGLLPSIYPASKHKSSDQRPLHHHYAQLVPACTSDYVEKMLSQESHPLLEALPHKSIALHHFRSLRRLVLDAILKKDSMEKGVADNILANYLPPLLMSVPLTSGAEPGFSASMTFALTVFEYLATRLDARFPQRLFLPGLMNPLMRRFNSRKIDSNRIREVLDLAIQYLEGSHQARAQISFAKWSFTFYVAIFWSRDTYLLEERLITLLCMESQLKQLSLTAYQPVLRSVKQPFRYRLLRIICLHAPDVGVDIDTIEGLKAIPTAVWPMNIFHLLPRDDSLSLLKRLMQIHPEGDFLDMGSDDSAFSRAAGQGSPFPDANVLVTQLQQGTEDGELQAQIAIKALQAKATSSREQVDRASFAQSALLHAIASGSLDLFRHVVLWMRRFQRDSKTVVAIYRNDLWSTSECVALLCGIPQDLKNGNAPSVRGRITKANSIILDILKSAVKSLREPFFSAWVWHQPLSLFREVVRCRIQQAGRLKRGLQLSEDELYEILWAETALMLLEAEKVGLEREHEALAFNDPRGPTAFSFATEPVRPPLPSSYRFLDNVARSRDKLWQEIRPTWNPAVAGLDLPWPKGLPIQCLMGSYIVATDSAWNHTPFLATRATQIVMLEPAQALREVDVDEETKQVIGQFVDNFGFALAIFIMQSPSMCDRDAKLSAASLHAINRLCRESMTEGEVQSFWRPVFQRALPSVELPRFSNIIPMDYPAVPADIDPLEPTEWTPGPSAFPKIDSRKLAATALDCMLVASQYPQWSFRHQFDHPDPHIDTTSSPPIWTDERLANGRNITSSVREGLILAALLLQASDIEGASKFLTSPFPSEDNLRYPALFLDEEFLRAAEKFRPGPVQVLSRFINFVPSTLLSSLAISALDLLSRTPLDSKKIIKMQYTAFEILRLLSKSDRPQLATHLIIHIVLDRPSASSWHRQLLTKSLVSNLAASVAKELIESFASQVKGKLDRQASQPKAKTGAHSSAASPKPLIKVTTVKFLAQFLDDANFGSPGFAVDVLVDLFKSATHVDVRVAVVDTILGKLSRYTDSDSNGLVEKTIKALECTVPVIGSLNERHYDQRWEEAEKTGQLLEVYNGGDMKSPPPIFNMVLRAVTQHRIKSKVIRTRLIESVLLPAIEYSKSENTRWLRKFVLKYSLQNLEICPPSFPVKPTVLDLLIEKCYGEGEIPEPTLDLYHQLVLINLMPSAGLAALNQRVNENTALRQSNEGQHWLSLYGRGAKIEYTVFARLLLKRWLPSFDEDGTRLAHVQDLVVHQAMALLELEELSFSNWNHFMAVLAPPLYRSSEEVQDTWLANAKPVVQRIINSIESLRTTEWQKSKFRKPAMLPDMYDTQLWMWPYPHLNRSTRMSSESSKQHKRCAPFGARVILALCGPRGVSTLGLAHHGKLKCIKNAVMRCSPEDRLYLAWFLGPGSFGGGDDGDSLDDIGDVEELLLRAELACALLREAKLPPTQKEDDGPVDRERSSFRGRISILDLLDKWKGCEIEEIRMRGLQLCKHLGV